MDLLVTDLDGTLVGASTEFYLYTNFRDLLLEQRKRHNTVWTICTGRPLSSFKRSMVPMASMGIIAEYAIINHAQIYELTRFGYMPHLIWNNSIQWQVHREGLLMSKAITEWYNLIMSTVRRVRVTNKDQRNLRMRFAYEEDVNAAMTLLEPLVKRYRNLQLFRYRFEIDIRPIPFTKGLAVSELSHHLGIGSESILAIGDGYNDISMFDSNVAQRVGCPANAEPEVMQVIHQRGGHIASQQALAGVIEIMQAYETGTVKRELPEWWKDPALGSNPRQWKKADQKKKGSIITPLLILASLGTIVLALAKYRLLPVVSGLIWQPFNIIVMRLGKLAAELGW